MSNKNNTNKVILFIASIFFLMYIITSVLDVTVNISGNSKEYDSDPKTLKILSSPDNEVLESNLTSYAKKKGYKLIFEYAGDIEIVDKLNSGKDKYDAVWISNSMWLYMLNNSYLTSDSKSVSISPVVFGIKKSKAKELGLIDKDVSNGDILNLINEKKIKYVMSSVTQTNTGATAYLGFLSSLAGNPEVLTEEMLDNTELRNNIRNIFSGVERVSGDEKYLEEMFINGNTYEAVIASESSLININRKLKENKKEELYLIYPTDGVAINDSTFAFIDTKNGKEETFLEIQKYLLSDDGQKMLEEKGYRTWYGGVTDKSNKDIFNPEWGIDTTKYLNVTRFPSKSVINAAINLYIEELRKPTHIVFCLDFSGSMQGTGFKELSSAMEYILDYKTASKDKLQFSKYDKITVITFGSSVANVWTINNGQETEKLIKNIKTEKFYGSTALYDAIKEGIKILANESDDYTKTIIAMTDGQVNVGTFKDLERYYKLCDSTVPIYSITFGEAVESELEKIAELSNAKVFDGKTNLLEAFKEVRGYN